MGPRPLVLAAVLLAVCVSGAGPSGQEPTPEGPPDIAGRLQELLLGGDRDGYRALLDRSSFPPERVEAFLDDTVRAGVTRAVVRERDRGRMSAEGIETWRLLLEVFTEAGPVGRVATLRVDLRRARDAGDASPSWRIVAQERLTSVDGLLRLALVPTKQFTADGLVLVDEDFSIAIGRGSVFVAEGGGGPTALVVTGEGTMRFAPKPAAERGQVRVFSGHEALDVPFSGAFVRVHPDDLPSRIVRGSLQPRPVDAGALRRAEEIFAQEVGKSFTLDLSDLSRDAWSLVPSYGDFLAEVRTRRHGTLTYTRSGDESEDISLFDRRQRRNISVYASPRKLASRGQFYSEDDRVDYDVVDYDVDAALDPAREWIEGRVRVRVRVNDHPVTTLTLRLAEPLAVRAVTSGRYGRILTLRVRGQNSLILNLPEPAAADAVLDLTVAYGGRLPSQPPDREAVQAGQQPPPGAFGPDEPVFVPEPRIVYSNRSYWYPQSSVTDYATATLRLSVPAPWDVIATGDADSGSPTRGGGAQPGEPERRIYVFRAGQPVRYLTWVVSRFVPAATGAVAFDVASPPASTQASSGVYYSSLDLTAIGNPRQVARGRAFLGPVREMLATYSQVVEDLPYPSFTLAVVDDYLPGGHSPAYFALVHQPLPATPYSWRNDPVAFEGFPQFFLAHEVAHQFWGQAVGWKSYHEQWISEGFAQYFAYLYAERTKGAAVAHDVLRQMCRSALRYGDEGPVWLGYRLGHIKADSRVFRAVVYNKGALVLHMLRRLVGEEPFFRALRRFYRSSRFRKVGTDDLQRAFEAETGRELGRFFEPWILQAGAPTVTWRSIVEEGAVRVAFRQDGAAYVLPLTVTLTYGSGEIERVMVVLDGPAAEHRIPLRGALRALAVNDDAAALARVERR